MSKQFWTWIQQIKLMYMSNQLLWMNVIRTKGLAPKVAEDSKFKGDQSFQQTGVNVIKTFFFVTDTAQ